MSASGASSAALRYDPLGRLYETSGGAAGVTRFLYDGDELVAEYNSSGTMLRRYVHSSGVDDPMAWFEGAGVAAGVAKLIKTNHQGSVIALTDWWGNLASINAYDEYGIPGATNTGRFQYTGQAWIPELGMYYYKARIYSPTLGRFMQTDPIGYKDQMNLYAYVGNDPVNMVDPTGMTGDVSSCGRLGGTGCSGNYGTSGWGFDWEGTQEATKSTASAEVGTGVAVGSIDTSAWPRDLATTYEYARRQAIEMVEEEELAKEVSYSIFRDNKYGNLFTRFAYGKDGTVDPVTKDGNSSLILMGHVHNRVTGGKTENFFGIEYGIKFGYPGPSSFDLEMRKSYPSTILILHQRSIQIPVWKDVRF